MAGFDGNKIVMATFFYLQQCKPQPGHDGPHAALGQEGEGRLHASPHLQHVQRLLPQARCEPDRTSGKERRLGWGSARRRIEGMAAALPTWLPMAPSSAQFRYVYAVAVRYIRGRRFTVDREEPQDVLGGSDAARSMHRTVTVPTVICIDITSLCHGRSPNRIG